MSNAAQPAYPVVGGCVQYNGLTKRELFAAMAMQAFLSDSTVDMTPERTAEISANHADALLAELEKGKDAK